MAVLLSSATGVAAAAPSSPLLAFSLARSVRLAPRAELNLSRVPAAPATGYFLGRVAIFGNAAVVGALFKNSLAGAA